MQCLIASMNEIAALGETGLVIFFAVFVVISAWALTRPRTDVRQWADIPLEANAANPTRNQS